MGSARHVPALAATVGWMIVARPVLARADAAADLTRARELFVEGSAKAEAGDWEAARDRFARSANLKRASLTLYNLGIAQEETGHLLDALGSFRAFLAAPAEPSTARYVDPVKADMAKIEARLARIEVAVRPAGVAGVVLLVDGRAVPPAAPYAVDPGAHEIAVTAPGFGQAHQKTALGEGARTSLTIDLQPRVEAAPISLLLGVGLTAGGAAVLVAGGVVLGLGIASRPNEAIASWPRAQASAPWARSRSAPGSRCSPSATRRERARPAASRRRSRPGSAGAGRGCEAASEGALGDEVDGSRGRPSASTPHDARGRGGRVVGSALGGFAPYAVRERSSATRRISSLLARRVQSTRRWRALRRGNVRRSSRSISRRSATTLSVASDGIARPCSMSER